MSDLRVWTMDQKRTGCGRRACAAAASAANGRELARSKGCAIADEGDRHPDRCGFRQRRWLLSVRPSYSSGVGNDRRAALRHSRRPRCVSLRRFGFCGAGARCRSAFGPCADISDGTRGALWTLRTPIALVALRAHGARAWTGRALWELRANGLRQEPIALGRTDLLKSIDRLRQI